MNRALPQFIKPSARRALRALSLFLLRLRSRPLELSPKPLLVVAPHPDDDVLGCGGLLSRRRQAGLPASVLYLTDGAASHPGHPAFPPERLAELRRAEATRAAASLGIAAADLIFFDLPDGRLPHLEPERRADAVARLAGHLRRLAPATVLLPLRADGSSEHKAAHALFREALRVLENSRQDVVFAPPRMLEFPVWALWRPTLLLPLFFSARRVGRVAFQGEGAAKSRAIAMHASQVEPLPPWTRPVLPAGFTASFSLEEEFFLELGP